MEAASTEKLLYTVRESSVQMIFIKMKNGKIDFQFSIFHFFTTKKGSKSNLNKDTFLNSVFLRYEN